MDWTSSWVLGVSMDGLLVHVCPVAVQLCCRRCAILPPVRTSVCTTLSRRTPTNGPLPRPQAGTKVRGRRHPSAWSSGVQGAWRSRGEISLGYPRGTSRQGRIRLGGHVSQVGQRTTGSIHPGSSVPQPHGKPVPPKPRGQSSAIYLGPPAPPFLEPCAVPASKDAVAGVWIQPAKCEDERFNA